MCILPGSRIVSELGAVAEEAQRRSVVILVWIDTNRQYLVTSPPPPFPPPPVIIPLTTNTFYNKTGGLLQQAVMPHNIALPSSPSCFEVQVDFLTRHYPYQKNIICMDGVFTSILRQCNNYKVSYSPSTFYTSHIPIIQIFSSHSFGPLLNSRIWFIKNWPKYTIWLSNSDLQLLHRCTWWTMYIDYTQYSGKQKPPTLAWHDDDHFSKWIEQYQCTTMPKLELSIVSSEQWAWRGGTVMVTNDWRLSPGHQPSTLLH